MIEIMAKQGEIDRKNVKFKIENKTYNLMVNDAKEPIAHVLFYTNIQVENVGIFSPEDNMVFKVYITYNQYGRPVYVIEKNLMPGYLSPIDAFTNEFAREFFEIFETKIQGKKIKIVLDLIGSET